MANKHYDLTWGAERSTRYHDRRLAFYKSLESIINTLTLLFGSAAIAALLGSDKSALAVTMSVLVAIGSFIALTMRPATMAEVHSRLKQRFVAMSQILVDVRPDDEDKLRAAEKERLDIEREEPPIYRALDLLAHNELCLARGKDSPDCLYVVPWWMAATANLVNWDVNDVPSRAQVALQKRPT